MKFHVIAAVAVLSLSTAISSEVNGQEVTKWINGTKYTLLRGSFNQTEAWLAAEARGGHAVVFNSMYEHSQVISAFGLGRSESDVCWTGHYQSQFGWEPAGSWWTISRTGAVQAPIRFVFNGNGPDDGISRNSPRGLNEDGAVIWKDNNGLLEDVGFGYRANVLIEYRR